MPSPEHNALVDLVRTDPAVITDLLVETGELRIPPGTVYRIAESTFSELKSIDFHVDLALTVPSTASPSVLNVLTEVQLHRDPEKLFSWPVYVTLFRRQHKRGVLLVVVTTEQDVADWIGEEILLSSDGSSVVVHVIGPELLHPGPDTKLSQTHPAFAVIVALAHCKDPSAFPLVKDGLEALARGGFSDGTQQIVYDSFMARAHEAVRQALERHMTLEGYEFKSELLRNNFAAGRNEGREEGRKALVTLLQLTLAAKGISPSTQQLARVESCTDLAQISAWCERAMKATTAADVFDA